MSKSMDDAIHFAKLREQGYLSDDSLLVTSAGNPGGGARAVGGAGTSGAAWVTGASGAAGAVGATPTGQTPGCFPDAAARMLAADPDARVAFLSTAPCTLAVAKSGARLPVLLDDLAQLTGPSVPRARDFSAVRGRKAGHSAVFVAGEGCLCRGSDAYEAHALAMVVEKACMAFIGSSVLGGGKRIPFHEALLMRLIYKMKYGRRRG